jgi:hypothetical protein
MAALKLPPTLIQRLGPEMKMDTHWVDVKLRDGRTFMNLVVRGGAYLTGRHSDPNGEDELPFRVEDVASLRRHAFLGNLWPFWR